MRRTVTATFAAALVLVAAVPALADTAGTDPVQEVEIGPTYTGDSGPSADHPAGIVQYWRYGGMGKKDQMVVDVTNERPGGAPLSVCLSAGANPDRSASGAWCTLAAAVQVGPGTTRVTFRTTASTYEGHLAFGDPVTGAGGPYRFTIVSNEHVLGVFTVGRTLDRSARLKVFVTFGGEGEYEAPKGTAVTVVVRKGDRSWTRTGTVGKTGTARVPLDLPKAALGRARLTVTAAADGYLDAPPLRKRVRVV